MHRAPRKRRAKGGPETVAPAVGRVCAVYNVKTEGTNGKANGHLQLSTHRLGRLCAETAGARDRIDEVGVVVAILKL